MTSKCFHCNTEQVKVIPVRKDEDGKKIEYHNNFSLVCPNKNCVMGWDLDKIKNWKLKTDFLGEARVINRERYIKSSRKTTNNSRKNPLVKAD